MADDQNGVNGRLVFGHFVNHREPKGSRFVLDGLHKARMSGADFAFIFAERASHLTTLELFKKIDVYLDQFTIGFYGLAAVEASLMGKPVIVWLNKDDAPFLPVGMWEEIPFINATAWEIPETIIRICKMDRDKLAEIGRKGKRFVEKWHDHGTIAEQILRDLGEKHERIN